MKCATPTELANMSHNEREAHMDALAEAGMDDGPEWDALYRTWAVINGGELE